MWAVDGRIRSLDGLRGLAALVVVVDHLVLATSTRINAAYLGQADPERFSPAWWAVRTPLHALWHGKGAVLVFFVLSGFALAAGTAGGRRLRLSVYFPQRVTRLFVPVAGALALALLVAPLIPAAPPAGATEWLGWHMDRPTVSGVLRNAAMIFGTAGWQFTAVLWSMQWEAWFSLLLPAFLALAWLARGARASILVAVAALGLICLSRGRTYLEFMPVFALGVLLAFNARHVAALGRRLAARRAAPAALLVAAAVLLSAPWWLPVGSLPGRLQDPATRAAPALAALGAMLVILVPLTVPWAERFLSSPVMQWLGKRSFSLYLVHETVVVTLTFVLGGAPAFGLLLVLAIPLILLVTEGFFRLVEAPSHRASRRIGRFAGRPAGGLTQPRAGHTGAL